MKKIAIYVEGGGDRVPQRAALRVGFDALLDKQKQSARQKNLGWKLVPCGGRNQTYDAFVDHLQEADPEVLVVLLVDAEDAIAAELPTPKGETPEAAENRELDDAKVRKKHLQIREKHWKKVGGASPLQIHLMVRCGEAWIASDPDTVASYYGKGFLPKRMPSTVNLEGQSRHDLFDKLKGASAKTKKGAYEKITHASKLLQLIITSEVAKLCPRFATFTEWLDDQIAKA